MDPVLADLIRTIALESIKVLGPAAVAAIATYKVANAQYRARLIEISQTNEFGARQNLFDYYKGRQAKLAEGQRELNEALGQLLGMMASADADSGSARHPLVDTYTGMVDMHIGLAHFDVDITRRDMKAKGLSDSEEYGRLEQYAKVVVELSLSTDAEIVKKNAFALLEVYGFLERCNQVLLEAQMEGLFNKYLKGA